MHSAAMYLATRDSDPFRFYEQIFLYLWTLYKGNAHGHIMGEFFHLCYLASSWEPAWISIANPCDDPKRRTTVKFRTVTWYRLGAGFSIWGIWEESSKTCHAYSKVSSCKWRNAMHDWMHVAAMWGYLRHHLRFRPIIRGPELRRNYMGAK